RRRLSPPSTRAAGGRRKRRRVCVTSGPARRLATVADRRRAAAPAMQLPPALHARLAGAPVAAAPLPVERAPAAGAAPFGFAARLVRFPREHAFFEDGDVLRHLYLQDVLTQVAGPPEKPRVPAFTCQVAGCHQVFDALQDFEHHYHAMHGCVCSLCQRAFPSRRLLDAHLLEWHDSLFQVLSERQAMYQCLVEGCSEKFKSSADRKDHLVRWHLYPADFRFDKPQKGKGCSGRATGGESQAGAAPAVHSSPDRQKPSPAGSHLRPLGLAPAQPSLCGPGQASFGGRPWGSLGPVVSSERRLGARHACERLRWPKSLWVLPDQTLLLKRTTMGTTVGEGAPVRDALGLAPGRPLAGEAGQGTLLGLGCDTKSRLSSGNTRERPLHERLSRLWLWQFLLQRVSLPHSPAPVPAAAPPEARATGEPSEGDAMEVCSEPAAAPHRPAGRRWVLAPGAAALHLSCCACLDPRARSAGCPQGGRPRWVLLQLSGPELRAQLGGNVEQTGKRPRGLRRVLLTPHSALERGGCGDGVWGWAGAPFLCQAWECPGRPAAALAPGDRRQLLSLGLKRTSVGDGGGRGPGDGCRGFLLPSALAKGLREDSEAPRGEVNGSDGRGQARRRPRALAPPGSGLQHSRLHPGPLPGAAGARGPWERPWWPSPAALRATGEGCVQHIKGVSPILVFLCIAALWRGWGWPSHKAQTQMAGSAPSRGCLAAGLGCLPGEGWPAGITALRLGGLCAASSRHTVGSELFLRNTGGPRPLRVCGAWSPRLGQQQHPRPGGADGAAAGGQRALRVMLRQEGASQVPACSVCRTSLPGAAGLREDTLGLGARGSCLGVSTFWPSLPWASQRSPAGYAMHGCPRLHQPSSAQHSWSAAARS
ncbi:LOW QUALITY PROTEIN: Zinc finger protein 511, partial [Galemys pyrenaicus]